jgi:hypothetical protein
MSQGFTKQHIISGIVRDDNAASPACFENNLAVGSVALRIGTTLTAHATPHTKATTYTTLIASTAQIANGFWLIGYTGNSSGADAGILLDIAKGAAASEVDLVQNINMGEAQSDISVVGQATMGKMFYFPGLTIPASTRISARIQATITVDTLIVAIWMDYRMQWQIANTSWVTYGANTAASQGTSVPVAINAFGAWTNIGTTSRNHNLFTVGMDTLGDTIVPSDMLLMEIGYGPTSVSVTSIGILQLSTSVAEAVGGCFPPVLAFTVASGSLLWARLAGAAVENRGVVIYGN